MKDMVYNAGIIDLSKRKIIDGNISEQVMGFVISLDVFRKEILFWFSLYDQTNPRLRHHIHKPICIELYEYTQYLIKLESLCQEVFLKVKDNFNKHNRESPLNDLPINWLKGLEGVTQYLKQPRNQLAAHRYTTKRDEFLTANEVIRLNNALSDKKIKKIRDQLFDIHDNLEDWTKKFRGFIDLSTGL